MNKKKNNKNSKNKIFNNFILWAIIIGVCLLLFNYVGSTQSGEKINFSDFREIAIQKVESYANQEECEINGYVWQSGCYAPSAKINKLVRNGFSLSGSCKDICIDGKSYDSFTLTVDTRAYEDIYPFIKNIDGYQMNEQTPSMVDYLFQFAPWLLIILFWFIIMRRMQGGGQAGGIFSFARSKAKVVSSKNIKILFKDVAGCEEAKTELEEIVQFLKNPKKYTRLGAKIPRGALLLGPPGTGKTLLAKAVSGEAKVPFFTISGAEFVEMFVGVGASRVRDLFEQAKKSSPSIIFIDEIDAVGRHRGAGLGGGHDEREQTLNQILVEMDGFDTKSNVILLAATNRPDVLDKALLRPGRFDRQIVVDIPDVFGREAILKIHTTKVKLDKSVNLQIIAKGTPGLAGADLENLVNEAALLAARRNKLKVSMSDFEEAKDKIMMGNERKSMILTDNEKKVIAYHEGGHALVAFYTKEADPVHKITIIPRGRALGITAQIPEYDRYNFPKKYLLGKIDILMGGRSAEKLIFKDTSTGASNDIEVATNIARKMVCEWGMNDIVGPLKYGKKDEEVFLGKELGQQKNYSEEKSIIIDNEIAKIVKNAEKNADKILLDHKDELILIAKELIDKETISGKDMSDIVKNKNKRDNLENKVDSTPTSSRRKSNQ